MKKLIITLVAGIGMITAVAAQRTVVRQSNVLIDMQPLVLIDSVETTMSDFWLNPNDIVAIRILKDSVAIAKYGEKAKNGVILISTKPNTEVIKLSDLITQYELSVKDKDLKVCKDKILVENPDRILVSKSDIARVEVITDNYWHTPLVAGPEERFINIVMKRK